jgi:hypothetical protein
MTDIDTQTTDTAPITTTSSNSDSVYKRWHRSGFINIGYFAKGDKITVEIGSTDGDKGLKSATKCFLPAAQFLAYLRAEVTNNLLYLYPQFPTKGDTYFGGNTGPTGIVSRVFKTAYWGNANSPDPTARSFKCGHFVGTRSATEAITPDYKQPISTDMIKVDPREMAEILEILTMRITAERVAGLILPEVQGMLHDG